MTTQIRSWEHDGNVTGEHGGAAAKATGGSVNMPVSPWLMPIIIVLAMLCGLAIGLTGVAFSRSDLAGAQAATAADQASKAERESRMLEYYLLELDSKFISAGLKDPAESIASKLKKQREKDK